MIVDRAALPSVRGALMAWSPDVVIDMILSSEAQAHLTLGAFRGIARRVVAASSGDVYRAMALLHRLESEPLEAVPLTEQSSLRTQSQTYSPEALATIRGVMPWVDAEYDKVRVERTMQSEPDLPATILRLPMVYGPGDMLHRFHPLLKRMEDGRPAILQEQRYAEFVPCRGYVENVAEAIALAATSGKAAGRIYNVCEPLPYSEAEWTEKIGAAAGWRGRVVALAHEEMPPHLQLPYNFDQHLFMNSGRIRSELGYTERVPLEEAIRRTVDWERRSPPPQINLEQFNYEAEQEAYEKWKSAA